MMNPIILAVKCSGQVNQKWVVKARVSAPANGNMMEIKICNHNSGPLINTSQEVEILIYPESIFN